MINIPFNKAIVAVKSKLTLDKCRSECVFGHDSEICEKIDCVADNKNVIYKLVDLPKSFIDKRERDEKIEVLKERAIKLGLNAIDFDGWGITDEYIKWITGIFDSIEDAKKILASKEQL